MFEIMCIFDEMNIGCFLFDELYLGDSESTYIRSTQYRK